VRAWLYRVAAALLVALGMLTALTGPRTPVAWFKVRPGNRASWRCPRGRTSRFQRPARPVTRRIAAFIAVTAVPVGWAGPLIRGERPPGRPRPGRCARWTGSALGRTLPAGGKFAGGWTIADTTPVRHPVGNLDAAHPRATSFEVIFPTTTKNDLFLLLAVCTSATFPAAAARLAGATLGDVLTNSPHTACHLLTIKVVPRRQRVCQELRG